MRIHASVSTRSSVRVVLFPSQGEPIAGGVSTGGGAGAAPTKPSDEREPGTRPLAEAS